MNHRRNQKCDAADYIAVYALQRLGYKQSEISDILLIKPTVLSEFVNEDEKRTGCRKIHIAILNYVLDHCKSFCGLRTRCDGNYDLLYQSVRETFKEGRC